MKILNQYTNNVIAWRERKACQNNEMTGNLRPGENRPLYGYGQATKMGLAGWHCDYYTINGKRALTIFFDDTNK